MIISYNDINMSLSPTAPHPVARRRTVRGWSQAELARRARIPRSSVSAIESRRLIPSVASALAVARALGCSVEELFAEGIPPASTAAQWACPPHDQNCRFWEAEVGGQRWLYPVDRTSVNPIPHDGIWSGGVLKDCCHAPATRTLVIACCDPAAHLLAAEYARVSGFRMIVLSRGGAAALHLLKAGRVHVAGLHRSTKERPLCNVETARDLLGEDFRMIRAAHWVEGIALPASTGVRSVRTAAARIRMWALRERGAAARDCLEELREGRPVRGRVVRSHFEVAESVRAGWAQAGVCVQIAAQEVGLRFLPVRREALDLCYWTRDALDPRLQALVRLLRSREHRKAVSELPGYEAKETGELVYHA